MVSLDRVVNCHDDVPVIVEHDLTHTHEFAERDAVQIIGGQLSILGVAQDGRRWKVVKVKSVGEALLDEHRELLNFVVEQGLFADLDAAIDAKLV